MSFDNSGHFSGLRKTEQLLHSEEKDPLLSKVRWTDTGSRFVAKFTLLKLEFFHLDVNFQKLSAPCICVNKVNFQKL